MKNKKICLDQRSLIITDLDGSLLASNGVLTNKTKDVIEQLVAKGHIVCLATGRPLRGSLKYYNALNLDTPIANFNAANINMPKNENFHSIEFGYNKEVIANMLLNPKISCLISNVCIETVCGTFLWKSDSNEEHVLAMLKEFQIFDKENLIFLKEDCSNLKGKIFSTLVHLKNTNQEGIDEFLFLLKKHSSVLSIRPWSVKILGSILEINSKFANKGIFARYLSAFYAIPLERCYAFGDGDNDVELLQTVGNGYAMYNAKHTPKLMAKLITEKDHNHNGVAWELSKIFDLKF